MRVYCDSAYNDRLKVAGIGIVIQKDGHERTYSYFVKCASNNLGELYAIKLAGIIAEGKGIIYTDSMHAINYIKGNFNKDKPRTLAQYIEMKRNELVAYEIRAQQLQIEHIKGHQHNFQLHSMGNRLADLLAKRGIAKYIELQKVLTKER